MDSKEYSRREVIAGGAAALVTQAADSGALRVSHVEPVRRQPAVDGLIYADRFDAAGDQRARYFEYDDSKGGFVWDPAGGMSGGAMRCTFQPGQVAAGALHILFGRCPIGRGVRQGETFREVWWRLYVKHERGWQGNPAKLARAICFAGPDWSQGMIAHVWGGHGDSLCIDPATGITNSRKVTNRYNDFAHLRWLGLKNASLPIFSPSESGRWVCVESHVRLNSPGHADGVFELWLEGTLAAQRTDLDWHGTWQEYGINALFVENYWNNGSPRRQSRWFDDLALATRPIGPITAARPVSIHLAAEPDGPWEAEIGSREPGEAAWRTAGPVRGVRLTVDSSGGRFARGALESGPVHWIRVRKPGAPWSPWHAPFR